jgi:hypothetical protein
MWLMHDKFHYHAFIKNVTLAPNTGWDRLWGARDVNMSVRASLLFAFAEHDNGPRRATRSSGDRDACRAFPRRVVDSRRSLPHPGEPGSGDGGTIVIPLYRNYWI